MKYSLNNNIAKYIAILYAVVIVGWIIITAIMQFFLYPVDTNYNSIGEALDYYQDHRGYIGLDHGTKGIVFLISSLVPLLFLKVRRDSSTIIGSFFGSISFIILSLSFLFQAFTAEFVIGMLNNTETRSMAEFVYNWMFLEGGITYSTYLVANIFVGAWVLIHSFELKKLGHTRFIYYGAVVGIIHIISSFLLMLKLIIPNEIGSTLSDIANFLFIVWFIIYGIKLDQKVNFKGSFTQSNNKSLPQ